VIKTDADAQAASLGDALRAAKQALRALSDTVTYIDEDTGIEGVGMENKLILDTDGNVSSMYVCDGGWSFFFVNGIAYQINDYEGDEWNGSRYSWVPDPIEYLENFGYDILTGFLETVDNLSVTKSGNTYHTEGDGGDICPYTFDYSTYLDVTFTVEGGKVTKIRVVVTVDESSGYADAGLTYSYNVLLYSTPTAFSITAPTAPQGFSFEDAYTVTVILPSDAVKGETTVKYYGQIDVLNVWWQVKYELKFGYDVDGFYEDGGFTTEADLYSALASDITVYAKIKRPVNTVANLAVLTAIENTQNAPSYSLKRQNSNEIAIVFIAEIDRWGHHQYTKVYYNGYAWDEVNKVNIESYESWWEKRTELFIADGVYGIKRGIWAVHAGGADIKYIIDTYTQSRIADGEIVFSLKAGASNVYEGKEEDGTVVIEITVVGGLVTKLVSYGTTYTFNYQSSDVVPAVPTGVTWLEYYMVSFSVPEGGSYNNPIWTRVLTEDYVSKLTVYDEENGRERFHYAVGYLDKACTIPLTYPYAVTSVTTIYLKGGYYDTQYVTPNVWLEENEYVSIVDGVYTVYVNNPYWLSSLQLHTDANGYVSWEDWGAVLELGTHEFTWTFYSYDSWSTPWIVYTTEGTITINVIEEE